MKKVNFKNVMAAFILTLGLMFTGVEMNAQAGGDINSWWSAPPVGNFANVDVASESLESKLQEQKAILATATGGYYTTIEREHFYYVGIYTSLQAGKDVPTAIVEGFQNLSDVNGHGDIDNNTRIALRQGAIDLLQ